MNNSAYGNYRHRKFSDIWPDKDTFVVDVENSGFTDLIDTSNLSTLYYLLYSKYGNSTIASSDENRFKFNVYSIIWQYGSNWIKRLDIQQTLRNLTDDELMIGSKQIYNNASNPGTEPNTNTLEELEYINNQNVTKTKKGKLDSYALLMSLLEDDVTENFIKRFARLFLILVEPELPLWYEGDIYD